MATKPYRLVFLIQRSSGMCECGVRVGQQSYCDNQGLLSRQTVNLGPQERAYSQIVEVTLNPKPQILNPKP